MEIIAGGASSAPSLWSFPADAAERRIRSAYSSTPLINAHKIVRNCKFSIGVSPALPSFPKDSTDRNRTSPFAFTGNRFEFRMVGSSDNIGCPNALLNTIVAEELSWFADNLEQYKEKECFESELKNLLKEVLRKHRRIIFNGDGYSPEWVKEAERRGLPNYPSIVHCMPHYTDEKNLRILRKFGIFNRNELTARTD